jgi:hypothetical protein
MRVEGVITIQRVQVNQWVTDVAEKRRKEASTVPSGFSPFLEQFLESNYAKPNVV